LNVRNAAESSRSRGNLCWAASDPLQPFVIGRKNWLFCSTVTGANASANLYSLIETAKANGIEPYAYLRSVFSTLPKATSVDEIEALLPVPYDSDDLARVS